MSWFNCAQKHNANNLTSKNVQCLCVVMDKINWIFTFCGGGYTIYYFLCYLIWCECHIPNMKWRKSKKRICGAFVTPFTGHQLTSNGHFSALHEMCSLKILTLFEFVFCHHSIHLEWRNELEQLPAELSKTYNQSNDFVLPSFVESYSWFLLLNDHVRCFVSDTWKLFLE